jgi:predicted AAA+ superfamily ATPase
LTWEIWAYEIDFIAQKNDKKIYIQVAYLLKDKETIDREFWNLEKITDNYPKYVVSLDEYIWSWINWIIHKNLLDFLSEIYSL